MTLSQIRRRWFLDHVDFTSLEKVEELLEDINEEYDWNLFDLMGNLIAGRMTASPSRRRDPISECSSIGRDATSTLKLRGMENKWSSRCPLTYSRCKNPSFF